MLFRLFWVVPDSSERDLDELAECFDLLRFFAEDSRSWIHRSVSCNGGSSRHIAYVWRAPATGSYTFSTGGSNFATVLQIRHYTATSEIMGCNDDVRSSLQSRITLSGLVSGAQLLIIIEGYAGEYGNYARLNIVKN
jgi:hypothetical protein